MRYVCHTWNIPLTIQIVRDKKGNADSILPLLAQNITDGVCTPGICSKS